MQRLKKLQSFIYNPILIKKKENLLYLTGRSFMHGYLLVKPTGAESDGRTATRNDAETVFLGDGLEKMEGMKSDFLKNVGKYIGSRETLEVFGEFTFNEVKYIKLKNPNLKLKVVIKRDPVDYQRQIKDAGEIALVRKSMQIVEKVFKLVRQEIKKPGMTEVKLAKFIEASGFRLGVQDLAFPPIVASGINASVPHHVPSSKSLKAGESIIIDFGFKYKNYCSDFTRTVFLKKVPKKLEMAYYQVEKAYNECLSLRVQPALTRVRRGRPKQSKIGMRLLQWDALPRNDRYITGDDLYQTAVNVLAEKHLEKYFIHSLGHGTGLEIHELPNLSPKSPDKLQNGMVFSIEPGVYFPNLGGIRVEDLVYLRAGKCQKFINLSTRLEDNII